MTGGVFFPPNVFLPAGVRPAGLPRGARCPWRGQHWEPSGVHLWLLLVSWSRGWSENLNRLGFGFPTSYMCL